MEINEQEFFEAAEIFDKHMFLIEDEMLMERLQTTFLSKES